MKQFADYEVIEPLGSGNHGECIVARPPPRLRLECDRVALKILAVNASPDVCRRVANELPLVASVRCPQLVPLYDAGHQGGTLFYATEYIAGGSLARPAAPPSRERILHAVADAARAAHALHDAGVVHRAIKPANIMLDGDGAKLTDVGLAHVLSPGQTMTGIGPIDSIEFVEPGALLGRRAGRASDIWSLAVTLHRALTSSSVYGELPTDGMLGALRHVLETPVALAAGLSDEEAELLSWCLCPDRSDRPGSAAMVADRLDRIAGAAQ